MPRRDGETHAGKVKPAVVDTPIIHLDFVPTLLTLVGLAAPAGLDGIDISPLLLGTGHTPARKFFWHFPHYNNQGGRPAGAVRDGDWKYVAYYDTGESQLFNLKDDVGERSNLAAKEAVLRLSPAPSNRRHLGRPSPRINGL